MVAVRPGLESTSTAATGAGLVSAADRLLLAGLHAGRESWDQLSGSAGPDKNGCNEVTWLIAQTGTLWMCIQLASAGVLAHPIPAPVRDLQTKIALLCIIRKKDATPFAWFQISDAWVMSYELHAR